MYKAAHPSLNHTFNALSIGVQYTVSFQWTNFCPEVPISRDFFVLSEMYSCWAASFFMVVKCYYSQKNFLTEKTVFVPDRERTHRENIPPGNLCIIKTNVNHQQKAIFFSKNIYLYNLWYLAALKSLNIHGGVILTLKFPENIIFLEKLLF